jgi:CsoR family transcriptional regulator, copper-sensing transcriptional repressor
MKTVKERTVHRAKIVEGQFKGLQKQINEDAYCMDILTQSLAIQKSLASLNKLVLENHIATHIQAMMASGDEAQREKALDELSQLYELNNIRSR